MRFKRFFIVFGLLAILSSAGAFAIMSQERNKYLESQERNKDLEVDDLAINIKSNLNSAPYSSEFFETSILLPTDFTVEHDSPEYFKLASAKRYTYTDTIILSKKPFVESNPSRLRETPRIVDGVLHIDRPAKLFYPDTVEARMSSKTKTIQDISYVSHEIVSPSITKRSDEYEIGTVNFGSIRHGNKDVYFRIECHDLTEIDYIAFLKQF